MSDPLIFVTLCGEPVKSLDMVLIHLLSQLLPVLLCDLYTLLANLWLESRVFIGFLVILLLVRNFCQELDPVDIEQVEFLRQYC